jgi:hypothetical protein
VRDQYKCWNEELLPALAKHSIRMLRCETDTDSRCRNI